MAFLPEVIERGCSYPKSASSGLSFEGNIVHISLAFRQVQDAAAAMRISRRPLERLFQAMPGA